ncbi:autophagy-related protein 13-domain-containing protein [Suillus subalutaceus]|uniref:autophagy-related protein 13-domain-containing protein n=1 Tax=Suillus subalutaceus TaxID=48586 RepID=UPI001B866572|nr:autophagy-related protein 13-domain-containing protein [Suillus subalutaceus]KAG1863173.1 autophagy-related protein 13-domain-containing protein [Suillus subalutaceus]
MSNDIQKADQIAHRFYTKLCLVVSNARATSELRSTKVDKWFNLETPDSDLFRDHLRIYKAVSTAPAPPPFELQVLLSVPDLITNQVLVHLAHDSSRSRVDPTPRHIVLENWLLNFVPEALGDSDADSVAPSTIYKHGIPLFRSIYSLLRILPSWKLYKKLRRRTSNAYRNGNLSIHLRVKGLDDGVSATDILDFDTPPAPNAPPLQHQTHLFPAIPHPSGTLSLAITYLSSPNFQLDELESLLSSRFLSLDEGPEFTPTLAKNQQRDSLTGLLGSLPLRASLPKSPPSSIADRFVLPAPNSHSRTNSMPVSQSPRLGAFPMSRTSTGAGINAGSTSALSIASSRQDSSTAWSKEDTGPFSGVSAAARIRLESMAGRSSSADLPSAPAPLPIRRPGINPVHPFKTSTLSSGSPSLHSPSPSLRQPSPLSAGNPSLPSRPVPTSPNASRVVPHSSIGFGRQSPSSIGGRSEGEDTSPKIPTRKRYSSSFGHRYAAAGGSGERAEMECSTDNAPMQSTSFLGAPTDDDEISIFVKDIDARKPLNAQRQPLPASTQGPSTTPSHTKSNSVGSAGPMLTREEEVDERLRHMNETFLASLEGLGGGRRRGSMGGDSTGGSPISSASGRDEGENRGMRRTEIRRETSRPRLGSLRSMSANDVASSGGSAEVMGKLELDEEPRARRQGPH